jgi:hypothetical protein
MSHWAELDNQNIVLQVTVGDNNDFNGDEGYLWLMQNKGGRWIKTSFNAKTNGFRKNFAAIGFYYDENLDAFIPPQPFSSWRLDEFSCQWEAPTPMPTDGNLYQWDESTLSWKKIQNK